MIPTQNVGSREVEVVDERSEVLRDFILRHALFFPKRGDVKIDVHEHSDQHLTAGRCTILLSNVESYVPNFPFSASPRSSSLQVIEMMRILARS